MNTEDAWLPRPPLTSCCAAQSLIGHRLEAWVDMSPGRFGEKQGVIGSAQLTGVGGQRPREAELRDGARLPAS